MPKYLKPDVLGAFLSLGLGLGPEGDDSALVTLTPPEGKSCGSEP